MNVVGNVKQRANNLRERTARGIASPRQRNVLKWSPVVGAALGVLVLGLAVAEAVTLRRALR